MLEHFFDELACNSHNIKPAFISHNEVLSYQDLLVQLNRFANALLSKKINGILALILPNTIETCVIILACLKAKITFVAIDANFPKSEMAKILKAIKPAALLVDQAERFQNFSCIYQVDDLLAADGHFHYQTLYYNNEEAFVTLTSGSTGIVKGVVHTNFSLCEAISNVLASLQLQEPHTLLCTIGHPSNAFLRNMLACLIQGATFILGQNAQFETILQLIQKRRPTHIRFSIKDLILFSELSDQLKGNFDSIIRCDVSGDTIPVEVMDKTNALLTNGKLITSYAMSECSTIAINAATDDKARQVATGQLVNTLQVKLVDDAGNPSQQGEPGELLIKSTTLFKRYLHEDELTANAFDQDGWFKTGDRFVFDKNGDLLFQGRKKHIIVRDGKNINPEYIRHTLLGWPAIQDCVVLGRQSNATIAEPIAFCTAHDAIDATEFKRYIQAHLHDAWQPSQVYIMKNLPRTGFGKTDLNYIKNNMASLEAQALTTISL